VSEQTPPNLPERAARSAVFTILGHGAATVSLALIIWLTTTVSSLDKQLAEMRAGVVSRLDVHERQITTIQRELANRTENRFTTADGAALEVRLLREISSLEKQVARALDRLEKLEHER